MIDQPHRVQRKRTKGWRMPFNTVSVCRPGKWGNQFKVGDTISGRLIKDRKFAVRVFRVMLRKKKRYYPSVEEIQHELRGKNLACFCPLDQPCHADVLLEIANG